MELLELMEYVCLVVTVLMFLTGIMPCFDMYQTGSTKNVPYELFVLSIISCGGMFHYGLMIDNSTISFLNGFGLTLQLCYVCVYLTCVQSKSYAVSLLLACVAYLVGLYGYIFYGLAEETSRAELLGSSSSLVTTLIVCLPSIEIVSNLRQKNADGMPLVMLLGGTACGLSWLVYGMLLEDPNIYAPNIPALLINGIKLYIISLYGQANEKVKAA